MPAIGARTAFDVEAHLGRLAADGFTVIEGFLAPDAVAAVRAALAQHLGSHTGRNGFEGLATERVLSTRQ